jgi:hypothetical protein
MIPLHHAPLGGEVTGIPIESNRFEATDAFWGHGAVHAGLVSLVLASLVLAPCDQGRLFLGHLRGDVAMAVRHGKCLQGLKVVGPGGLVAIPHKSNLREDILTSITQGRVLSILLEAVLIALPVETRGERTQKSVSWYTRQTSITFKYSLL